MIVNGTREFDAAREIVWSVIDDPAQMAGLMPGVEAFEVKDARHWQAKVKVPLGLGGLKMTIDFEKLEERPPEFASMNAKGKGVGAMMNMTTSFSLSRDWWIESPGGPAWDRPTRTRDAGFSSSRSTGSPERCSRGR